MINCYAKYFPYKRGTRQNYFKIFTCREFVGQNAFDLAGDREDLLQALRAPRKRDSLTVEDQQNGLHQGIWMLLAHSALCVLQDALSKLFHSWNNVQESHCLYLKFSFYKYKINLNLL